MLVWSIVLYGIAAFCRGFATSLAELIFWRCITVAGACVEFVAAIAWLTELFPETKRREAVLGFAQVCATLGNFMIAGAYYAAVTWGDQLPAVHGAHSPWRYALLFGALPAIPLMILRPFLPESPVWQSEAGRGHAAPPELSRAVRAAAAARDDCSPPCWSAAATRWPSACCSTFPRSCPACRRWRTAAPGSRSNG